MELSKKYLDAIKDVQKRSKGWPVGIPVEESIATFLVDNKLAIWSQPAYVYPVPVFAISLTSWGKAHLK